MNGYPAAPNKLIYQTNWLTMEIGGERLCLSQYRLYSPTMGRFHSIDPMGPAAGFNLFGYVNANPVNRLDPWGLDDTEDEPKKGKIAQWWDDLFDLDVSFAQWIGSTPADEMIDGVLGEVGHATNNAKYAVGEVVGGIGDAGQNVIDEGKGVATDAYNISSHLINYFIFKEVGPKVKPNSGTMELLLLNNDPFYKIPEKALRGIGEEGHIVLNGAKRMLFDRDPSDLREMTRAGINLFLLGRASKTSFKQITQSEKYFRAQAFLNEKKGQAKQFFVNETQIQPNKFTCDRATTPFEFRSKHPSVVGDVEVSGKRLPHERGQGERLGLILGPGEFKFKSGLGATGIEGYYVKANGDAIPISLKTRHDVVSSAKVKTKLKENIRDINRKRLIDDSVVYAEPILITLNEAKALTSLQNLVNNGKAAFIVLRTKEGMVWFTKEGTFVEKKAGCFSPLPRYDKNAKLEGTDEY